MELEIQVILEALVVVGDYEVPKQPLHQFEFYEDVPALVVVVDPLSTKRSSYSVSINLRVRCYDYRNTIYIHWSQKTTRESLKYRRL